MAASLRNMFCRLPTTRFTALLNVGHDINITVVRGRKRWIRPLYKALYKRRIEQGPEKERHRSEWANWNYESELYAFGKRLGEDFQKETLSTAFIHSVAGGKTLFKEVYKIPMASLHLIGHSMGGRVVALAVENFKDPLVGRITALDPLPGKYKGLATFTDVIHTTFLADDAEADADFWPNNLDIGGDIPWVSPHMYAVYMYTMSVSRCDFVAHECTSWNNYRDGQCASNPQSRMGHNAILYPGRGKMFLEIKKEPPFC